MTQPHRNQTQYHRTDNVRARPKPFAALSQFECLPTERGKRGVTAAHAVDEKWAEARGREPASFRGGEGRKKSDDERAGHVDDQRAQRKCLAEPCCGDQAGKPETTHAAQRAAHCHPQVCKHSLTPAKVVSRSY